MKSKSYEHIGETVISEKLPNGLTVFVIPKRGFSKKFAMFATNYGAADRRFKVGGKWIDTPEGVAHFLEHKMFDMEGYNALSELTKLGANPNAFTSTEMTAYYFTCTNAFDECLKQLLTFVSTPYFTEESIAKERGIIGQEIGMTDDEPDYALYFNLMKALYKNHPMRHPVAGSVESIAEITTQTLYDCHKIFYTPSNMVLCVAGDVDAESVISAARNILPTDRAEIPSRDYGENEGMTANEKSVSVKMDVGMPQFMVGYKCGPGAAGKDFLKYASAADIALRLMAGRSSKLFTDLYGKGLINKSFDADFESVTNQSHAIFAGESKDPDAVIEAIRNAVADASRSGFDKKSFERVKKSLIGSLIRSYSSFENMCIGACECYFKNCDAFAEYDALLSVTQDDVMSFIKTRMLDCGFAVSTIMPTDI